MRAPRLLPLLLAWAGLAPLVAAGCGYSTRRLSDLPAATRSVAVLTLENLGFRRDLELRLTQALLDEIRARTPYAIGSAATADVLVSGRMQADESVITLAGDGSTLQQRLGGTLEVTLTERATGRVLKSYVVYANTEFTPGRRHQTLEGSAADEWVRRLAEGVVRGFERAF